MTGSRIFLAVVFLFSGVALSLGQGVRSTDIGFIPSGMYQHTDIDSVNLENGNSVIHIPLFSLPQRGSALAVSYSIVANTSLWQPVTFCSSDDTVCDNEYQQTDVIANPNASIRPCASVFSPSPSVVLDQSQYWCDRIEGPTKSGCWGSGSGPACSLYLSDAYYVVEPTGGQHRLWFDANNLSLLRTTDGSEYLLRASDPQAFYPYLPPQCSGNVCSLPFKDLSGSVLVNSQGTQISGNVTTGTQTDTNGNSIQFNQGNVTDTIGRGISAPPQGPASSSTSGCPTVNAQFQPTIGSATWTVPGPNGQPATYLFCYAKVLAQTNFWGYGEYNYVLVTYDSQDQASVTTDYTEGGGFEAVLQSVVLPNGKSWQFVYDAADPSASTYSVGYGNITKIISPTGSSISYTYGLVEQCGDLDSQGESENVQYISQRTVTDANGNQSVWKYAFPTSLYSYTYPLSAVETDPSNNDTVVSFIAGSGGGGFQCLYLPAKTTHYAGSYLQNQVLQTEATTYQTELGGNNDAGDPPSWVNAFPATTTTTDELGNQQTTSYSYDSGFTAADAECFIGQTDSSGPWSCSPYLPQFSPSFGLKTAQSVHDFNGQVLRTDLTEYKWQDSSTGTSYYNANLLTLPCETAVFSTGAPTGSAPPCSSGYQGNAGLVAQTGYNYDENNGSPQGSLGNQTSVSKLIVSNSSTITSSTIYDSYGMPISVKDANGNTTSITYDTPDLFPKKVQRPTTGGIAHIDYYSYDDNTGSVLWHTDENGSAANDPAHTTYYTYADPFGRLTQVLDPPTQSGQGQTNISYNDSALTVTTTVTATPNPSQTSIKTYDSLGRLAQTTAPSGATQETTYDVMGRVASVTNPHFASQSNSDGTTTYAYDALGRMVDQCQPDNGTGSGLCTPENSYQQWSYSGPTVTFKDEAGNQWQRTTDGLGRLVKVLEPNGLSQTPSMETDYGYDPLGNLLSVKQWGGPSGSPNAVTRSFAFDSLSRLVQAFNPESGWTCYGTTPSNAAPNGSNCTESYDGNGNLTAKTDARGIKTAFTFDALNRLTWKSYSDAEGPVVYGYDVSSVPFGSGIVTTVSNPVGRLAGACRLNASQNLCVTLESFSYDSMGRVEQQWSLVPSGSVYTQSFGYDVAGDPTQTVLPVPMQGSSNSSLTLQYNWDNAQHLNSIMVTGQPQPNGSLWNSTAYLSNPTLLQAAGYDPFGHLVKANLGITASQPNGAVSILRGYDNRGRITSETDGGKTVSTSAAQSKGSISLTGTETSGTTQGTSGSGVLTVIGSDGTETVCTTTYEWINAGDNGEVYEPVTTCDDEPATGTLSVTINGFTSTASYGSSSTDAALASVLASGFSLNGSPVKAVASGSSILVTAIATGTASNYPITISSGGGFVVSDPNSALSGGSNSSSVYDAGTVTATITNNFVFPAVSYTTSPVSWGQGSTSSSLASSLASAINSVAGSLVTASASGSSVQLVSKTTGPATNYTVSVSISDTENATYPSLFPSACFQANATNMTGGQNAASSYGTIYSYSVPAGGYAANGNLLSYTDYTVMGTWNFQYDTLNRLTSANTTTGAYSGLKTTWSYDTFGNRTAESFGGSTAHSMPTSSTATFNANNRVSSSSLALGAPLTYDAAGNVIYDGTNFYAYDGEGKQCAVYSSLSGTLTAYDYNAEGQRVAKGTVSGLPAPTLSNPLTAVQVCNLTASSIYVLSAQYLLDRDGNQVTELNTKTGPMAWAHTNIWAGGALDATYDGTGLHFNLSDPLGTRRVQLAAGGGSAGCVENSFQSLPWGSGLTLNPGCGNTQDATEHHFTGKERDTESGNDYFRARYYASPMGRFLSPDPITVTPARVLNPQQLNLYAYVANNPLRLIDPTGMIIDDAACKQDPKHCGNDWQNIQNIANQKNKDGSYTHPELHKVLSTLQGDSRTFTIQNSNLGAGTAGKFTITDFTADGKDFTRATLQLDFKQIKSISNVTGADLVPGFNKFQGVLDSPIKKLAEVFGHEGEHGIFSIQNPAQAVGIQRLLNDRDTAMQGHHYPYPPDVMQKIEAARQGLIPTETFAQQGEKIINGELQADKKK